MNECIFCKIIAGELPAHKVYEDDLVVAILDIQHWTKGHTLIMPKLHYANMLEIPDELLAKISVLAKDLALNYKPVLGADGFNVVNNTNEVGGQEVMHYHMHLIPRYEGHKFKLVVQHKDQDVDLDDVAATLRGD